MNQDNPKVSLYNSDEVAARLMLSIAKSGLNQAEFARRLGVSAGFVSDAARGIKKPGTDFLLGMRTVFGISIDWLLTGEGTMHGGSGIDVELMRSIRLQIDVVRAAVMTGDSIARQLLRSICEGKLQESTVDSLMSSVLNRISPEDNDFNFALELYNGHLWTDDADAQRRNLLAAAIAHYEARIPIDKVKMLSRVSSASALMLGVLERNAERD
ncbi:MAG: hypothetical protein RL358_525 [Pseudomonadota bacterium]|jgi:transcriptional regulator with XRE-family HTH domain